MTAPTLFWFRRDLRLSDNPALTAAAKTGAPVLPVFILDPETEALGAAPRWRLGAGLRALSAGLEAVGSRLILRRGPALSVLRDLAEETGATTVHWGRLYDPTSLARDTALKTALTAAGLAAKSHAGHVLFEPWTVETGQGQFYKVYTPFWKAVRTRDLPSPLPRPRLAAPETWPRGDGLAEWGLGKDMNRGGAIVAAHANPGEDAAADRLAAFADGALDAYDADRDRLDRAGTSGLSENLSLGEISPRTCWFAGLRAMEEGKRGAETFLKEIVWRDFAHHLVYHTPHIVERNWRPEWDRFAWRGDSAAAERWRRGLTGEPVVDAAMREMYVTGRMHNRGRMLVASYLTKHLLTDWRIGLKWFEACLIDWDPASNAMGWQWSAGSGPDATPFFRIFNPATQAEKFDPMQIYRRRWVAEFSGDPGADALSYFDAEPKSWGLAPDAPYPKPLVDLKAGREAALAAYQDHRAQSAA